MNISYASHEAVEFADKCMEMISYYAILASSELAKERGTYPSYKGSKWDRGLLPIDTIDLLEKERGGDLEVDRTHRYGLEACARIDQKTWDAQQQHDGDRPDCDHFQHHRQSPNRSNRCTNISSSNQTSRENSRSPISILVERLKKLGLWDEEMLDDLKYFDGSISEIERIPQEIKQVFLTAFEIDPEWMIECASRRQKWIDMGQSLNLYIAEPSGKKLHQMYYDRLEERVEDNLLPPLSRCHPDRKIDDRY